MTTNIEWLVLPKGPVWVTSQGLEYATMHQLSQKCKLESWHGKADWPSVEGKRMQMLWFEGEVTPTSLCHWILILRWMALFWRALKFFCKNLVIQRKAYLEVASTGPMTYLGSVLSLSASDSSPSEDAPLSCTLLPPRWSAPEPTAKKPRTKPFETMNQNKSVLYVAHPYQIRGHSSEAG